MAGGVASWRARRRRLPSAGPPAHNVRSEQEHRRQEQPDHRKDEAQLHQRAQQEPCPGCDTGAPRALEAPPRRHLADDRACERTDDQARQADEEAEQRAERGTDRRATAHAKAPGADRRRSQIHEICRGREQPQQRNRGPANASKPVRPGREQQAGEDEDRPREGRQHGPGKPHHHQRDRGHPEQECHGEMILARRRGQRRGQVLNVCFLHDLARSLTCLFPPANLASPRDTSVRLLAGSIRFTIERALRTLKLFGHSSSGRARNSLDRAGVR